MRGARPQPRRRAVQVDVQLAVGVLGGDRVRRPHRQRRLAHPTPAVYRRDHRPPLRRRPGGADQGEQPAQLRLPAGERRAVRRQLAGYRPGGRRGGGRPGSRCVLAQLRIPVQHRPVQPLQRLPRLDAELLGQRLAGVAEHVQRAGDVAGPVQGADQDGVGRFPGREGGQVGAQRGDRLGVPAEAQVRLRALLDRRGALLLQRGAPRRQPPAQRYVLQGPAAPDPAGLLQPRYRRGRIAACRVRPRLADQLGEPARVQRRVDQPQHVPGSAPDQYQPFGGVRSEQPPQVGRVGADVGAGRRWRLVAPHLVDQLVHGHILAVAGEQEGQNRALLRGTQRQRPARVDLQRAKHPDIHCGRHDQHILAPARGVVGGRLIDYLSAGPLR